MTTGYSSTFTVLGLASITLSSTSTSYSENCDFTVTATLKDQNGGSWTQSTSLQLTGTNVLSDNSLTQTTSTGSYNFVVYCSAVTTTLTITVKSGSITGTLDFSILQNQIKISSVSPTVLFI